MRIDDIYKHMSVVQNSPGSKDVKESSGDNPAVRKPRETPQEDAKVELSDISLVFSTVKEILDKDDPQRAAKVNAIKEAVVRGEYKIDSRAVADKILTDSLLSLAEE